MPEFLDKVTQYISANPKITLIGIVLLIIIIIWLLFKYNIISDFLSKKSENLESSKLKKKNLNKTTKDIDNTSDDEPTPFISEKNKDSVKPVIDPVVSKLVNDINKNS